MALRRLRDTGQEQHENSARVRAALAEVCDNTNRPEEAAQWRAELAALSSAAATTQAATKPTSAAQDVAVRSARRHPSTTSATDVTIRSSTDIASPASAPATAPR